MKVLPFQRSTPEAEGIPSQAVLDFVHGLDALRYLHGFLLFRHGRLVAEGSWHPYRADVPHALFSLSKSFVSCAIGFALSEGLLKLSDKVVGFFPEAPRETWGHGGVEDITIENLLTMASGQPRCFLASFLKEPSPLPFAVRYLQQDLKWKPGEHFNYNSGDTFLLSAIVQRVSGKTVEEYLTPRLLEPLGIAPTCWQSSPDGVNLGGWGFYLRLEDIARFALMLSQHGVYGDRQVVPREWLETATACHIDNSMNSLPDWRSGYGYQFWRCNYPGAYRGDGAHGQYVVVVPSHAIVLATTAGLHDMHCTLDCLWEKLLPAISGDEPLPEDPEAAQRLATCLNALELPKPDGAFTGSVAPARNGYSLSENDFGYRGVHIALDANGGEMILEHASGQEHAIPFGIGSWREGYAPLFEDSLGRIAASAAWIAPDTLKLHLATLCEPQFVTYKLHFTETGLELSWYMNLWFRHDLKQMHCSLTGLPR